MRISDWSSDVCSSDLNALTMLQLLAGCFVEIGSELRECSQFTVLSQSGTDTTRQLLDDLGLSSTTNTGYRDTGVDGRTDTCVEHGRFQEDLTIGDGNQDRKSTRLNSSH